MASTPSNDSRKGAHRKRSPSPSASSSSQQPPQQGPSTPIMAIKGRYERASTANSTGANKLLHTAVTRAAESAATSSKKPSPSPAPAPPFPDTRAQFEQQEDFISFDASPEPEDEEDSRGGRGTPRDGGRSARKGKRSREERDEERDEEGTARLRKREKGRSTPWCDSPGVEWRKCETAIEMLNAEARAFVSYISPTPVEHELRLWTIELIRRTIKTYYPDADVECFGSVGTGLYLPGGDIDLVVLSPSMPSPPLKPQPSLLHRLASLLLTSSLANPSSLVVIAKARVPIVKFTTRYGGFSVDLSVNQKNGVDAAVRVRGMLEDFAFREEGYVEPGSKEGSRNGSAKSSRATTPAIEGKKGKKDKKGKGKAAMDVDEDDSSAEEGEEDEEPERKADEYPVDYGVARCMVLLVKAFLSQRGMNEVFTGGLGSYSIICMVISFLQLHPRIQTSRINPNRNLGLLFVEFLELYGKHFNYDEAGITLRGRGGYYNKHDKGWFRHQQPYLLSIEDPNDPQNDVSGGSHAIIRVRQTFAGGFDTLTATLLHRHSLLSSRKTPSLLPLSAASLPNADSDPPSRTTQSLLGSIIGMTSAGVEARDANVMLWEDRVLQKLLRRTDPSKASGKKVEDPTSKKALKKFRKEEKEREKRERTIARLERRQEEKELKRERKERKKRERIEGREASTVVEVRPLVGETDVHAAQAAAASLGGLAGGPPPEESEEEEEGGGFVIDTVGAGRSATSRLPPPSAADEDDEEDDSRYSLGVPAVAKQAAASASASGSSSRVATYTSANDSDSDSDEDEEEDADGDVILGGTGGDFVRFDSVGRADEEGEGDGAANISSRSGSASSEEVVEALVPQAKRAKRAEDAASISGPTGTKGKRDKKAKMAARIAFWGKKGPREE
ncbi:hypothetical protein JCM11251_005772 [Rhodosporidiobolus azoricus]